MGLSANLKVNYHLSTKKSRFCYGRHLTFQHFHLSCIQLRYSVFGVRYSAFL